jgi:O-antigen/teichoic acid export membrane protein
VTSSAWAPGSEARSPLANVLYRAGSVLVEKVSRIVLVVGAAPILGEAAFGGYQFSLTLTGLFALCADLGLSLWTTRALARDGARDRDRASVIVGTGLRLRASTAAPFLLAVGLACYFSAPGDPRNAMALFGAAALANAFIDYFGAVFRGYERLDDEAALNVIRALLVTGAGLGALAVGRSLTALATGFFAGTLGSAACGLWLIGGRYRILRWPQGHAFDWSMARAAVAESAPIWLATLLSLVYFKVDVVIVRALAGNAELGAYSAAYKVFEAVMIFPSVVTAAAFAPLARTHADSRRGNRGEILVGALLLGLGALVGAVLYLGADRIVALLFGPAFARAVPSLRILTAAVPVMFLNAGLIQFLIARGLEWRNLAVSALLVAINVGVNLAIVPRLGGPGAAFATLITEGTLAIGCLAALRLGRVGETYDARE